MKIGPVPGTAAASVPWCSVYVAATGVRALVKAQRALREHPSRATEVGRKRFPPAEADIIAELIRRDAPFYQPTISPETVRSLNTFARNAGLLSREDVPYEDVVVAQCVPLWQDGSARSAHR